MRRFEEYRQHDAISSGDAMACRAEQINDKIVTAILAANGQSIRRSPVQLRSRSAPIGYSAFACLTGWGLSYRVDDR
jgi:hypothetical protein